MKKTALKALSICATCALVIGAVSAFAACGGGDNDGISGTYTISKTYNFDNLSDIPTDVVNFGQMEYMANSDLNSYLTTELTLDTSDMSYTLHKEETTDNMEDYDNPSEILHYYFYGTFEITDEESGEILLKAPETGEYSCWYPAATNYSSIETSTSGELVSSTDYPKLLTRFNKWYPVSNVTKVVDQPVTLSGKTMTFGDVNLSDTDTTDDSSSGANATVVATVSGSDATITFYDDNTISIGSGSMSYTTGTWALDGNSNVFITTDSSSIYVTNVSDTTMSIYLYQGDTTVTFDSDALEALGASGIATAPTELASATNGTYGIGLSFMSDGTLSVTTTYSGSPVSMASGTWTVNEGALSISVSGMVSVTSAGEGKITLSVSGTDVEIDLTDKLSALSASSVATVIATTD